MSKLKTRTGLATISLAVLLAAPAAVAADQGKAPKLVPVVKIHRGDQCVEPKDQMRQHHMDVILHQRDETMRRGIRTTKHSLRECVNCHADPKTGSVLGKDGFCQSCHKHAAVTIDCFACHNPKAEKDAKVPPLRTGAAGPASGNRIAKTK